MLFSILQCTIYVNDVISVSLAVFVTVTFLCLAPFASFVADVKCGRFKTLLFSTYILLVSNIVILIKISVFIIINTIHKYLFFFCFSYCRLNGSSMRDYIFLANIIQFGTDQLRDAPTRHSIAFLYAVYWCERLVNLLVLCMILPGLEEIIEVTIICID